MNISYAITVCNEFLEIQRLIKFLLDNKRTQDNIVVLFDEVNGDSAIESFLRANSINGEFHWHKDSFNGNFADWKNKLTSLCNGDYIFQIDADEMPEKTLIDQLPGILQSNPDIEVYLVPRVNIVEGITNEHIKLWRWNVNKLGWINWPDFQWRIYKNTLEIKWKNKIHEVLDGFTHYAPLPITSIDYTLYHSKTIERQEKQNSYYETL